MIVERQAADRRRHRAADRGPLILKCDGCGKRATPSRAERDHWLSDLGQRGGEPSVLDLCPACVAMLRSPV